jgi:hypothetical protein
MSRDLAATILKRQPLKLGAVFGCGGAAPGPHRWVWNSQTLIKGAEAVAAVEHG